MRVDQHRQHAQGRVVLDEAHAAHVGGEVVDDHGVARRSFAGVLVLQIQLQILRLGKTLVPLVEGLDIDGADRRWPCRRRSATRWPPMKPPPPHTTIKSFDSVFMTSFHLIAVLRLRSRDQQRAIQARVPRCLNFIGVITLDYHPRSLAHIRSP